MNNAQWLKEMQCLYAVQPRPAWVPRLFWLSTQQRIKILSELLMPQTKQQ
ncbi:hypothetical protein QMZ30_16115 [Pantoea sp. EA-12]|nr:hypothetical protein [Pantoea sp. EA-12]MDI9222433.1 hypothetical protein [Pantoea sp. EA-12]